MKRSSLPINQHLDWEHCLNLTRGNAPLAKEMLQQFLADLGPLIHSIDIALQKQDNANLQLAIHRLQGACCYISVPQLKILAGGLSQENTSKDLLKKIKKEILEIQKIAKQMLEQT